MYAKVLRGRAGLGNFSLKDEYKYAALDTEDLRFPYKVIQPDDILKTVKSTSQIDSLSLPQVSNADLLEDLGDFSRNSDKDAILPDTIDVSSPRVESRDSEQNKVEFLPENRLKVKRILQNVS